MWEAIAPSFDRTRRNAWAPVEAFLAQLPPGQRLLDLMAGNGRNAWVAASHGHHVVAADWSRPAMAEVARRSGTAPPAPGKVEALACDALALPFRDATFDAALFVAGLHGLVDGAARAACLAELARVLRPGGRAIVTVWWREHPRFRAQGPPGEPVDVVVPWRADGLDEPRHYHLMTQASLRAALQAAGFVVEALQAVAIAAGEPDNLVALVRRDDAAKGKGHPVPLAGTP